MNFIEKMRAGLREATGLVRSGSLSEATETIQRALRVVRTLEQPADAQAPAPGRAPPPGDAVRGDDAGGTARSGPGQNLGETMSRPGWRQPLAKPGAHPGQAGDPAPNGQFFTKSYSNSAGTRNYKLFVPTCYKGQALPLIVMLHGCTQTPDDFAAGTRMNLLAEEMQCFVAYPAQARRNNAAKCWSWFNAADQQRDRGEPSIIAGITVHIMATYSVDAERVYIAGLSAGGAMAAIMAMTYPDLYAAVGIHSGLAYAAAHDPASAFAVMKHGSAAGSERVSHPVSGAAPDTIAVPMIVFHGDKDTTVHPLNASALVTQWNGLLDRSQRRADSAPAPEVTVRQGQVPGGHAYTHSIHYDDHGQVVLEHWEVHGAGHAWAGGSSSGSYTDPQGPDAAGEMVRFFYRHRRGHRV